MSASSQVNRANALHSTGPKTVEGKRRSSRNALKHGVFAKDVLVPGESAEEFAAHKSAMIRRLNPRDVLELHLVEQIVAHTWKIRRIRAAEQQLYQKRSDELKTKGRPIVSGEILINLVALTNLPRLEQYQQRLSASFHRCLKELRDLRKENENPDGPLTDMAAALLGDIEPVDATPAAQNEAISPATAGPARGCEAASAKPVARGDEGSNEKEWADPETARESASPAIPKAA